MTVVTAWFVGENDFSDIVSGISMQTEQRVNIAKETARRLMWAIADDLKQAAQTPDSVLRNSQLMLALMQALRHVSKVAELEWCEFISLWHEQRALANLSTRSYGNLWMEYCELLAMEADQKMEFGQTLALYVPVMSPEDFKRVGVENGHLTETKTLTGRAQWVVNQ